MKNPSIKDTDISKFLSFVLRHEPQSIQLDMDEQGWVSVQQLIDNAKAIRGISLNSEKITQVVASCDKQRFKLSDDGNRIKANQGHSITVDLALQPQMPPAILYHGTASRFLGAIQQQGLKAMQRHHVHLSSKPETALAVGQRYGKPVLLQIDAAAMQQQGHIFYCSDNQVWLTDAVPMQYIHIVENNGSNHES